MLDTTAAPTRARAVHYPYLDGVRGIAITLVLMEHFAGAPLGRLGVDLFFALSGLLIAHVLFEQQVPLRLFYQRRIARIAPVFLLYLATIALATAVLLPAVPWQELAYTALFLRTYLPGDHIWYSTIPVGNIWSLSIEEHGYVLLSLIALIGAYRGERVARWLLVLLSLACVAVYQLYRHMPPQGSADSLRTECAVLPLLASAALVLWRRAKPAMATRAVWWGATVAAVISIGIVLVGVSRGARLLSFIVVPLMLAVSVNTLHTAPPRLLRWLSARWLMWLGTRSFSIYLWHYPFYFLANHGHWRFGPTAGLVISLLISAGCYRFFEQPMRLWIRNLGTTQRGRAGVVGLHSSR